MISSDQAESSAVCVIGLGRVGLTLALAMNKRGIKVVGVEKDAFACESLNSGKPHFFEHNLESVLRSHIGVNLTVLDAIPRGEVSTYIISVGTPLNDSGDQADLSAVSSACHDVGTAMPPGSLVILRSTVPIGTTREVAHTILREYDSDVKVAFCPERSVAGNAINESLSLPQIVSGVDSVSTVAASQLFSKIADSVVEVPNPEAAEAIKLIDNSYRDYKFAFGNLVGLLGEKIGLDGAELVKMANFAYPRNDIPIPGFVGGPCLTKDPRILVQSAAKFDLDFTIVESARRVNESLVVRTADELEKCLNKAGKQLSTSHILISGLAFKGRPQTDDTRNSPAIDLVNALRRKSSSVHLYGHDFIVPDESVKQLGLQPVDIIQGAPNVDAVVFMNNHKQYSEIALCDLVSSMNGPAIIIDGWRLFEHQDIQKIQNIIYHRLGGN